MAHQDKRRSSARRFDADPGEIAAAATEPADLAAEIQACQVCAERFAATRTAHEPRPVLQFAPGARILIASQAPGLRAHKAGAPFWDPSGERLRAWLGLPPPLFYDPGLVAILPMGFCFPGYSARGADLPPPKVCAQLWRERALAAHPRLELVLLIGRLAIEWHEPQARGRPLAQIVSAWRERLSAPERPTRLALPHPSWRNNAWLKTNPWFETETIPALQERVRAAQQSAGLGAATNVKN